MEVTDDVETGSGDDVYDIVLVASSRCNVMMDEVPTRTCSVSGVDDAKMAMADGEGVLGGRVNVCDTLVASDDKQTIDVDVAATTPLSSAHIAVAVDGR